MTGVSVDCLLKVGKKHSSIFKSLPCLCSVSDSPDTHYPSELISIPHCLTVTLYIALSPYLSVTLHRSISLSLPLSLYPSHPPCCLSLRENANTLSVSVLAELATLVDISRLDSHNTDRTLVSSVHVVP